MVRSAMRPTRTARLAAGWSDSVHTGVRPGLRLGGTDRGWAAGAE